MAEEEIVARHVFNHYCAIMGDYLIHFSKSTKYEKNDNDKVYLLLYGMSTLTHVFIVILKTTLNVDLALENMKKAIYYYTQFIDQIEENALLDLNISSTNAALFVYNKTIMQASAVAQASAAAQAPVVEEAPAAAQEPVAQAPAVAPAFYKNIDSLVDIYRSIIDLCIVHSMPIQESVKKLNIIMKALLAKEKEKDKEKEDTFGEELCNVKVWIHYAIGHRIMRPCSIDILHVYIKKYKHIKINLSDLLKKQANQQKQHDELKPEQYIKWLLF
jgi:hypothetical protein